MSEKRMISNSIYDSDEFLDMPHSAIALYTYLNLGADDEGFVGNTKSIMRKIRASDDDLKILLAKRFVLSFESGKSVVVIKHWLIHNTIRQDRIKETNYLKEKETLVLNEYGAYTESNNLIKINDVGHMSDNSQPSISNLFLTNTYIPSLKEIIDYLNNVLGSKYRYDNSRTNKMLNARLKNYTVEDIKKVIDFKYNEWKDNEAMKKYLRPETLFNETKFENYYNEANIKDIEQKNVPQGRVTSV